ncbi:hypothetical protein BT96DRAFT_114580 [Gymnopus androsaceus JB14]|uniref:Secreted protein n=1 Tax=Gymnopus androsaceus JB14 TaxID=1447944 RepID=A0A6A4HGT0_9AGAR|nr:hypothetical protein BT96DRAFT_114580 [Gymnopus androsaceus JB14]
MKAKLRKVSLVEACSLNFFLLVSPICSAVEPTTERKYGDRRMVIGGKRITYNYVWPGQRCISQCEGTGLQPESMSWSCNMGIQ